MVCKFEWRNNIVAVDIFKFLFCLRQAFHRENFFFPQSFDDFIRFIIFWSACDTTRSRTVCLIAVFVVKTSNVNYVGTRQWSCLEMIQDIALYFGKVKPQIILAFGNLFLKTIWYSFFLCHCSFK